MTGRSWTAVAFTLLIAMALAWSPAIGQHQHHDGASAPAPASGRRVTMEELHQGGGVPRGWKFTIPPGDASRGKQVFADLECYTCHAVKDGGFPAVPPGGDRKSTRLNSSHIQKSRMPSSA